MAAYRARRGRYSRNVKPGRQPLRVRSQRSGLDLPGRASSRQKCACLAQQNQGLNYYSGQNTQANQNAQQANQLQETAYGTEAGSGNAATGNVLNASQTPSTSSDKVITGVTGVLGCAWLSRRKGARCLPGKDAVVGEENGPGMGGWQSRTIWTWAMSTRMIPGDSCALGQWLDGGASCDSDSGLTSVCGSAQPKARQCAPFCEEIDAGPQTRALSAGATGQTAATVESDDTIQSSVRGRISHLGRSRDPGWTFLR